MRFPFGVKKMFWKETELTVAQHCERLNAVDLCTLKWLRNVKFTPIKKKKFLMKMIILRRIK